METFRIDDLEITIGKKGFETYEKVSWPVRYGRYSEIRTGEYLFQFNLNGELRFIQGRPGTWSEHGEWLKRTTANDWVHYRSGGYNGAFANIGEHYIPHFNYQSNVITGGGPFEEKLLQSALDAFNQMIHHVETSNSLPSAPTLKRFLDSVVKNRPAIWKEKKQAFYQITGGMHPVLPPDARHSDYDVIPLAVSEGCFYNCKFCSVKSGKSFRPLKKEEIDDQICRLKTFYGPDLKNYSALFLGKLDTLGAGERVVYAAEKAFNEFSFAHAFIKPASLYLFASVDSLLKSDESLFEQLNRLPCKTWINIGLESFDDDTLTLLGKPLTSSKVKAAFYRMEEINRSYPDVELTGNILLSKTLPDSHYRSFSLMTAKEEKNWHGNVPLYISPYGDLTERRDLLKLFRVLKNQSRMPTFLYIIQRL